MIRGKAWRSSRIGSDSSRCSDRPFLRVWGDMPGRCTPALVQHLISSLLFWPRGCTNNLCVEQLRPPAHINSVHSSLRAAIAIARGPGELVTAFTPLFGAEGGVVGGIRWVAHCATRRHRLTLARDGGSGGIVADHERKAGVCHYKQKVGLHHSSLARCHASVVPLPPFPPAGRAHTAAATVAAAAAPAPAAAAATMMS